MTVDKCDMVSVVDASARPSLPTLPTPALASLFRDISSGKHEIECGFMMTKSKHLPISWLTSQRFHLPLWCM